MDTHTKLRTALAQHGHRITSSRIRVYSALAESPQPLSNTDVINRTSGVDKVSVYRTLELFESIGVTHRVWNGFKSKVELSDSFSPHHHHFTCNACGRVTTFKSMGIEQALRGLEGSLKVSIDSHVVELGGVCVNCQKK